jgi:hypothetical protein
MNSKNLLKNYIFSTLVNPRQFLTAHLTVFGIYNPIDRSAILNENLTFVRHHASLLQIRRQSLYFGLVRHQKIAPSIRIKTNRMLKKFSTHSRSLSSVSLRSVATFRVA